MFSDRLQYYFGTSHIIKVYNIDIPFVDLNKYSWNKVIHLAQQQKEKEKKKVVVQHTIMHSYRSCPFSSALCL